MIPSIPAAESACAKGLATSRFFLRYYPDIKTFKRKKGSCHREWISISKEIQEC
jgi:hypothetical protein